MRRCLLIALPFLASLTFATSAAQAVVVDMSAVGSSQTTVPFNPSARGAYYGVSLIPSTRTAPSTTSSALTGGGIPYVTSSGRCSDPALAPDLVLPGTGICFHGGSVMHANEAFAL